MAKEQRWDGEDSLSWEGIARDYEEAAALEILYYQHDYDPAIAVDVNYAPWLQ